MSCFSEDRLKPYLQACNGDFKKAFELYEWNIDLGAELLKDIAVFEVGLRNAYDRTMANVWQGDFHWLLDRDSPVNTPILRKRKDKTIDANALNRQAINEASRKAKSAPSPNAVVSNLTLGFWSHLTDKAHERDLWIPYLHKAWPEGTNRSDLNEKICSINKCRNRISHHEKLFDTSAIINPSVVDRNIEELFSLLYPQQTLFDGEGPSRIDAFLIEHPFPARDR